MERNFSFAIEDIQKINLSEYEDDEFAVAKMGFLSTKPNAHGLIISEEVLRASAPSVLNKWLVADMTGVVDAGTHTKEEKIVGRIPKEQDVEFVYDKDGYLRAYVDVVISKIYAKDFCKIFEGDNNRAVSVEMKVVPTEEDENVVESFKIVGVTALGHSIKPSCPDSDIVFTRFSDEEADKFFAKVHGNSLTALRKFVEERKEFMAEKKTYKVDKSKDAMSDKPWGEVDKTELRNKIMEASNRASLVKDVYMLVEDGWEEAPSEHLKYPVMELKGDTFVYNRDGLASALGYAKKENETAVISKVEKIYKKLGLDESNGKEEGTKMSKEIEFAAVDIGDLWSVLYNALDEKKCYWDFYVFGIYEQDNTKFVILKHKDGTLYRLDFSYTEDGLTLADETTKISIEFVEGDEVKKFTEPENVEEYRTFSADPDDCEDEHEDDDSHEEEMSCEDMKAEMARLQSEIENRDNIIMEKDNCIKDMEAELCDLREFKKACMEKERACSVEAVMGEVKEFLSEEQFNSLRDEGMACEFAQIDAWSNKVKALGFEAGKKSISGKKPDVLSFAAPVNTIKNKSSSVWERL